MDGRINTVSLQCYGLCVILHVKSVSFTTTTEALDTSTRQTRPQRTTDLRWTCRRDRKGETEALVMIPCNGEARKA